MTKLLGSNTILEEGVRKVAFTRVVDDADLADLRGLEITTHLFQRWVPKSYEARVVVIGEHVTAAAIHAGSAEGYVDWRTDHDGSTYTLLSPPLDVVAGVKRLMRALDLRYGALDFVVTPAGDWVMLEINAGGQFGFVEDRTGAPLTDQFADLLAGGTR